MQITEVKVFPVEEEKLKAYVTITLDDCFIVRDLKVINGKNGMFVAMPSKKTRDGSFKDIAHPLNSDTRREMEQVILAAYQDEMVTNPHTLSAAEASLLSAEAGSLMDSGREARPIAGAGN